MNAQNDQQRRRPSPPPGNEDASTSPETRAAPSVPPSSGKRSSGKRSSERGSCVVETHGETVAVVVVLGEHDLSNAWVLRDELTAQAAAGRDVVLDLSAAEFVDSTALHAVHEFARRLHEAGRRLVLQLGTSAVVSRALEIGGVTKVIPCVQGREEALRIAHRDDV